MTRHAKLAAALMALHVLWGCASGGGGGGEETASVEEEPFPLICIFIPFICILAQFDDSVAAGGSAGVYRTAPFTSWAELERGTLTEAAATGVRSDDATPIGGVVVFEYDADGKPVSFGSPTAWFQANANTGNLAALGQPGIDRYEGAALVANPYVLGWNYQSFGAWNEQRAAGGGAIVASSFGQATPASAVPASGAATFTGKTAGFYVSPTGQGAIATSELTVNANFSARSLSFATRGTTIAADLKSPSAAPHLDLGGTLTYAPGSNAFSGTLTSAGGTLAGSSKGQFYGPRAEELGGAFRLQGSGSEAFTGAYGAKR